MHTTCYQLLCSTALPFCPYATVSAPWRTWNVGQKLVPQAKSSTHCRIFNQGRQCIMTLAHVVFAAA